MPPRHLRRKRKHNPDMNKNKDPKFKDDANSPSGKSPKDEIPEVRDTK